MMFSVPGPETMIDGNGSLPSQVTMASGWLAAARSLGARDHLCWAIDDGPPGAEVDFQDEEVHVPIACLDCTAMVTYDERQGWTWLDTDEAHHQVPHEASYEDRRTLRGQVLSSVDVS